MTTNRASESSTLGAGSARGGEGECQEWAGRKVIIISLKLRLVMKIWFQNSPITASFPIKMYLLMLTTVTAILK